MTGLPAAVTQLIAAGRIERVPPDLSTARLRLRGAEEKLAVANTLATIDRFAWEHAKTGWHGIGLFRCRDRKLFAVGLPVKPRRGSPPCSGASTA